MIHVSVDSTRPLYLRTAEFDKIERRHTRYRFDLERDIPWAEAGARGLHFGPTAVARHAIDFDQLQRSPDVFELFQWGYALSVCNTFIDVERALIRFSEREAERMLPSRSIELFRDDELKHIDMFRRYADCLTARNPDRAARFDAVYARTAEAHERMTTNTFGLADAKFHHLFWLYATFLEEWSLLLHDQLASDASQIQPTWLKLHACHRQEELQHLVTDAAHLEILQLTERDRYEASRIWAHAVTNAYGELIGTDAVWRLLAESHPAQADGLSVSTRVHAEFLEDLLYSPAFRRTREGAPYLRELAQLGTNAALRCLRELAPGALRRNDEARPMVAGNGPAGEISGDLRTRLVQTRPDQRTSILTRHILREIYEATGNNLSGVSDDTPMIALGLDSLVAVELAARTERILGTEVPIARLYDSSLAEFANHLLAAMDLGHSS